MSDPMTDADKIQFLAELAGWRYIPSGRVWPWEHRLEGALSYPPVYPHSLDAIARDLLPLLREKGWGHSLTWDDAVYRFLVWDQEAWPQWAGDAIHPDSPARAAFEAIYEAFKGGEE